MKKMDLSILYVSEENEEAAVGEDFEYGYSCRRDDDSDEGKPKKKQLRKDYRKNLLGLIKMEVSRPSCHRGALCFKVNGERMCGTPMAVLDSGKIVFEIGSALKSYWFDDIDL